MKAALLCMQIAILLICSPAKSAAWTLVYSHDANGIKDYGDIQTLINAVNAGSPVRFSIEAPGHEGIILNSVSDAETVWIRNNQVYAQDTSLVGSSFVGQELRFNQPAYYAFMNVSTTGQVFYSRWRVGQHVSEGESKHSFPIKWYIEDHRQKLDLKEMTMEKLIALVYGLKIQHLDLEDPELRSYLLRQQPDDLRLMRNAIYARNSYKFNDSIIEKYFRKRFPDYQPKYSDASMLLTADQVRDVNYIQKIESIMQVDK